jgi:enterochelin esterase-like enzyme
VSIDSLPTVLAGVVVVLIVTAMLALRWDRARVPGRCALGVLLVLAVTVTAALQVNRLTETYPRWSALADHEPVPPPHPDALPTGRPGHGRLATYRVAGPAGGMSMPMSVYLPAAYFTPAGRRLDFPVIEALHGYPGAPETWIRRLDVAGHLDREIAAGRMAPTVVLLPYQTPRRLLDTECTDLVGGPRTETYLTRDVPAWARAHLRVRTDRAAWGLTGYSAGAFCAMNLALRHPDQYAAAASLSGYPDPGITVGDGSERTTNDIAWRLSHLPRPSVALWIGWADDDKSARDGSRRIAALAKPPLTVVTATVPHGGHSHGVWRRMEGPAFDWLSAHLARPAGQALQ